MVKGAEPARVSRFAPTVYLAPLISPAGKVVDDAAGSSRMPSGADDSPLTEWPWRLRLFRHAKLTHIVAPNPL
jgi:hypothetical protein